MKTKLCKLKDKRETLDRKNVIYEIPCKECPGQYIGETSRQLGTRVQEHKSAIVKKQSTSQIFQHSDTTGHEIDFNNVKIIGNAKNLRKRLFLESMHTVQKPNSFNRALDIPQSYGPIIRKFS